MSLEFSPVRVLACRRGDPRTLTPGPRTPYGPSPRTTLQTGPGTPPTDPTLRTPHKKTIIKNDNQRFFVVFFLLLRCANIANIAVAMKQGPSYFKKDR